VNVEHSVARDLQYGSWQPPRESIADEQVKTVSA
jgi:hypothetical protein